jgi:hypothetical protein
MDSLSKGSLEELLLLSGKLADWVDLLDTVGTELDVGSEPLDTLGGVQRGLDEGWLDDTRLAVESSDEGVGESGTGCKGSGRFRMDKMPTHRNPWRGWRIRYRPWPGRPLREVSIRYCQIFPKALTVTTELDSLDESLVLLAGDALGLSVLAEQGDNGDTRVTTDDGHVDVLGVSALDLANESGSSDDVEGGDTEESLLVKDTGLLEDLGEDGDGRVDWVGDDQDEGLWRVLGHGLGKVSDDRGVGVL